jgi:hypothetical protein
MEKFQVKLKLSKETLGTFVYATKEAGAHVKSVYVSKSAFEGAAPAALMLTLEEAS